VSGAFVPKTIKICSSFFKIRPIMSAILFWDTVGDFTFDLTFAEPIRCVKVRSKYLLKPKSEVVSLRESLTYKSMV